MMLWIEGIVALIIMLVFLISSFFIFKPEHVEHHPARVRIGAALQGLLIGLIIGFVIVPLRFAMMEASAYGPPDAAQSWSSLSVLPAVLLLILVRRGALLRAPVLKTYLRAYRRAMLLRTRDDAVKNLAKLDELEGGAPA